MMKYFMIIIALITVIFLFGYGYVAEKSHRTKIIMEEWIGEHKEMLKTKDLSPRELIFIDSLKQLKFETVTFEKIEGYERYSLVLSYKRTRPFKPFFPDSSERFKLAIAQRFYCNYLNIHRKPKIHSIFVKDLDFSIPETEYSISELEMGCMK